MAVVLSGLGPSTSFLLFKHLIIELLQALVLGDSCQRYIAKRCELAFKRTGRYLKQG
jgi:hypothetical protein